MTRHDGSIDALPDVEIDEIDAEQGRALLAPRVRDELGIALDDFFTRLDAGEYDSTTNDRILKLVMLAPLAR